MALEQFVNRICGWYKSLSLTSFKKNNERSILMDELAELEQRMLKCSDERKSLLHEQAATTFGTLKNDLIVNCKHHFQKLSNYVA